MFGHTATAECLALGNLDYVLDYEKWVRVSMAQETVTLDFSDSLRQPWQIRLFPMDSADLTETETPFSDRLSNGLILHYSTETAAVGSGGPEFFLDGWIEAEKSLVVRCWAQTEYGGDPRWCIPVLEQLRPKAEGCATKED
jgi:hypothetical protein